MSFGVVEVLGPRDNPEPLKVQVATFRSDGRYLDGRHPEEVVFSTAREDALRRDFTINGMFLDPLKGELLDHVGGRQDLEAKVLRAIGDPSERFREDKLRLLRAVRMAMRFGLRIDPATEAAVKAMAPQITVVSAERIAEELRQILTHPQRVRGLELLYDTGLCAAVLPELLPMRGLPQGPPKAPTGDLWGHVMRVLECLGPEPSFPLALAALLHDVGKPRTVGRTPDRYTFYYHEHVGARMAAEICLRLKLSNAERDRVQWLVEKHQFLSDAPHLRTSKLKAILIHPGIRELLALHRADAEAWGHGTEHVEFCEKCLREWPPSVLKPDPVVNGDDLKGLGLEPGPLFKKLLDAVYEAQLEGIVTTKEQGLEMVRRLLKEWFA
jgi:poly(A) polymerase